MKVDFRKQGARNISGGDVNSRKGEEIMAELGHARLGGQPAAVTTRAGQLSEESFLLIGTKSEREYGPRPMPLKREPHRIELLGCLLERPGAQRVPRRRTSAQFQARRLGISGVTLGQKADQLQTLRPWRGLIDAQENARGKSVLSQQWKHFRHGVEGGVIKGDMARLARQGGPGQSRVGPLRKAQGRYAGCNQGPQLLLEQFRSDDAIRPAKGVPKNQALART